MRSLFAVLVGGALLAAPVAAIAADCGPSTPEERKQALEYIRDFEANPLNPNLKSEAQWLTKWIIEIPDVYVNLCTILDFPRGNKKDSQTLFSAMFFTQIKFTLEHPEVQADHLAELQAGVEGTLRTYELLLKSKPKDRQPSFDDLIQRREAGTLAQWVKERVRSECKK